MKKQKKPKKTRQSLPHAKTDLELISEQAKQTARAHQAQLQGLYTEMGECSDPGQLEADLQRRVGEELASLHCASLNLKNAQLRTSEMEDELAARLHDVKGDLNRKWYRLNPPSNT